MGNVNTLDIVVTTDLPVRRQAGLQITSVTSLYYFFIFLVFFFFKILNPGKSENVFLHSASRFPKIAQTLPVSTSGKCNLWMKMDRKQWWNDTDWWKVGVLAENYVQCPFVHHESYMG
jgi:hypothetical protein